MKYCLSVDLGSERDYTAISLLQRIEKIRDDNIPAFNNRPIRDEPIIIVTELHLKHLERVPLKTPYPTIVKGIKSMLNHPDVVDNIMLVVDQTGVGLPVMQMMYQEGLAPIGISIHAGEKVSMKDTNYGVPKRDIVTALLAAFQSKRFKMPSPDVLPIITTFKEELAGFKMKIDSKTGHDSYEAWQERIHDDLVISVAMGVWWMDKTHGVSSTLEERIGKNNRMDHHLRK